MTAYYNELDPFAADWLRELIRAGCIAPGDVDERSIVDVRPADLVGYTQCHFFAGIGGWSLALRLAGWPDDRPVWTGSCPCQPYSAAGKGLGAADPRNLWPVWRPLIAERRPVRVFGEQVASAIGHGWLDVVSADLEAEGYAVGATVLGAHSVGAPHLRQRLYWVADAPVYRSGSLDRQSRKSGQRESSVRGHGLSGRLGHADQPGPQGRSLRSDPQPDQFDSGTRMSASPWSNLVWLPCRDGKARPTQPGLHPLAHGVPARVGRLRGYGNAIVPQVAAAFIGAYLDA